MRSSRYLSVALLVLACGCVSKTVDNAGEFVGPASGRVIAGHDNCLRAAGFAGASIYGDSADTPYGRWAVCFEKSIGTAAECVRVGSNTPGVQVGEELRFPVDGVTQLPPAACAAPKKKAR
ncbi:MAG TPA: hypothetical protein VHW74_06950 [Mycobacteriales bacterium]|jgi:hypothetical protein|nr:hypothetical protein [Mycobacteriales bacterium]